MERTIQWLASMFGRTVGDWLLAVMLVGVLVISTVGVRNCRATTGNAAPCVPLASAAQSE